MKIFMKPLVTTLALVCISTFAMNSANAQIVLKLAENQPETNPVTVAMHRFAELVDDYSNGEVKVEVYSGAQLGQEVETIEQTQAGIIEMSRVNTVPLATVTPLVGVFTLPYIFRGAEHKYTVLDGDIGDEVRASMAEAGLVGFDFMEAGNRSFYIRGDDPLASLEDLKGKKIRVQNSPISIRMVELLGGVPTPMNYGEVYSALQTGVIDGAENDFVSYHTSSHYEVAPKYMMDGHLSPPAIVIMNKAKFDSLDASHQEAISRAAREAALYERELMFAANDEARKTVEAAGVTVYEVDNTPFQQAILPIYDEFPHLSDYIERISSTK